MQPCYNARLLAQNIFNDLHYFTKNLLSTSSLYTCMLVWANNINIHNSVKSYDSHTRCYIEKLFVTYCPLLANPNKFWHHSILSYLFLTSMLIQSTIITLDYFQNHKCTPWPQMVPSMNIVYPCIHEHYDVIGSGLKYI